MIDFDPMDFFNLSEKKRVEYICNIIGGSLQEELNKIDADYQEVFDGRTHDKKTVQELQNRIEPYDKTLLDQETTNAAEISGKLQAALENNATHERVAKGVIEAGQQIIKLQEELDELEKKIQLGDIWLATNKLIDTEPLHEAIANVDESNEKIKAAHGMSAMEQELINKQLDVDTADDSLEKLQEIKQNKLSTAINVDGLTYDGEQFLYNGLPFQADQINQSDIILAGLSIGASMLKDVRILRFDGSLLDNEKILKVTQWADQNDVQLFVEFVSREESDLVVQIQESI